MNILSFILGGCAGATFVLCLFYVDYVRQEKQRGDAECARVFGPGFPGAF